MSGFKPMLAAPADFAILRFPCLASVKLDGIRATVHGGRLKSRSMKDIPSRYLQDWCALYPELEGLDGELVVGAPTDPDTFRRTTSHVMADDKAGFDFAFHAFDLVDLPGIAYAERRKVMLRRLVHLDRAVSIKVPHVKVLGSKEIASQEELDAFEMAALDEGYEGVMLRDPRGLYKQGRSTARGQELLKVKRCEDMEAVIVGTEERLHNGNVAFRNELGRTARSSHQANKHGLGTLGALSVRGLNGPFKDVLFSVGTGLDDLTRAALWQDRENLPGQIVKVKYFAVGVLDKPRHPVYLGIRDPRDMDAAPVTGTASMGALARKTIAEIQANPALAIRGVELDAKFAEWTK